SRSSFGHWRRAAEPDSRFAARLVPRTEECLRYHGMNSRTPLGECTRPVRRATAFPVIATPQTPAPAVVPVHVQDRPWRRLALAARARRASLGASGPTAGR